MSRVLKLFPLSPKSLPYFNFFSTRPRNSINGKSACKKSNQSALRNPSRLQIREGGGEGNVFFFSFTVRHHFETLMETGIRRKGKKA